MITGVIVDDHSDVQVAIYRFQELGKDIHGVADTACAGIALRLTTRLKLSAPVMNVNLLHGHGLTVTCRRCAHAAPTTA